MKFINCIPSQYFRYYLVAITVNLVLRCIETLHVFLKFNPKNLLLSEFFGILWDTFAIGLFLIVLSPVYHFISERWPVHGKLLVWSIIGIFFFLHISISEYFFYQLRPLDIFVFKHKPEEMIFSVNTAGINVFLIPMIKYFVVILLFVLLAFYAERRFFKDSLKKHLVNTYILTSLVFIVSYSFLKLPVSSNLSINKSFFLYSGILKEWYRNHYGPDMIEMSHQYQHEFPNRNYIQQQYPFLHKFEAVDKLSEHLDNPATDPNLVIIIIEGLSDDFLKPVRGIQFMQFTDSLARQGLYWPHFFANSERSFAATPSIVGSLPFGKIGFALLNQYPYHFSLVNIFKENNYFTSFYYGQGAWFHGKEPFYKFNNIDQIVDKNYFHPSLDKVYIGEANHFWGYNDIDLFHQYFITTDSLKKDKRLDIFFTGTSHAPFSLKHPDYYHRKLSTQIQNLNSQEDREYFEKYRKYYTSLYNVDDALRYFFNRFYVRDDYRNTIFIITGDHPVTEIPVKNSLKKYHVPLIIYSPTIQCHQVFKEYASHLDLYETLLGFYSRNPHFKFPSVSTAIGTGLKFSYYTDDNNSIAFMNDNRYVDDFFYKSYYISDNQTLYKVKENLELREIYDLKNWKKLNRKMLCFRAASLNASAFNRLLPEAIYFDFFHFQLLADYQKAELFSMPSERMRLIQNIKVENQPVYIDFNFLLHDHDDYIPQCIVEIYNPQGSKLTEFISELKSHQKECQFHIQIPKLTSFPPPFLLNISLGSKEGYRFEISDLKVRVYKKKKSDTN